MTDFSRSSGACSGCSALADLDMSQYFVRTDEPPEATVVVFRPCGHATVFIVDASAGMSA